MLGAIAGQMGLQRDGQEAVSKAISSRDYGIEPQGFEAVSNALLVSKRDAVDDMYSQEKSFMPTSWRPTTTEEARSELWNGLRSLPDTIIVRRMCKYYFDEVDYVNHGECTKHVSNTFHQLISCTHSFSRRRR
jgi:hypothetical protein